MQKLNKNYIGLSCKIKDFNLIKTSEPSITQYLFTIVKIRNYKKKQFVSLISEYAGSNMLNIWEVPTNKIILCKN